MSILNSGVKPSKPISWQSLGIKEVVETRLPTDLHVEVEGHSDTGPDDWPGGTNEFNSLIFETYGFLKPPVSIFSFFPLSLSQTLVTFFHLELSQRDKNLQQMK